MNNRRKKIEFKTAAQLYSKWFIPWRFYQYILIFFLLLIESNNLVLKQQILVLVKQQIQYSKLVEHLLFVNIYF